MLAGGIVAGLHLLSSSIRTVDSAERLLELPVLSAVPTMTKSEVTGGLLTLVQHPGTIAAESFRTLRCSLALLGPQEPHRVFLFTSAVPGEGKSFVAVNTAIAFAQQGLKTLLLEADLRRPSLAGGILGMAEKLPGIGDYMAGEPAPINKTPIRHLWLLPSGSRIERPAELLSSVEFAEIIRWLRERFDRIVIDSAPLNVVSDTLNIVSCASVICLVIRCSSTPHKVVRRAVELLRRAGVSPDGLVLNRMPRWNGIGYHYDYSGRSAYGDPDNYAPASQEPASSLR